MEKTFPSAEVPRVDGRRPYLVVAGEGHLSSHEIRGELVIGRDPTCDVVIVHPTLSRRHAVLVPGSPPRVRDLGSTNGTRVHGERIRGQEVPLEDSGGFQIGPFTFVVVAGEPVKQRSVSGDELLRVTDPTLDGVPALVRELAASPINIIILGETGVGKEVLAETIHRLSGRRGELIRINCASLTEALLESELFGHQRGAFTGALADKVGLLEAADGGTVFLDEIGELPAGTQAKLLRAVEDRAVLRLGATRPIPIDVRFVAATHRDIHSEVERGEFRRDFFFRLDGVTLLIPPLRERRKMIVPLALRFLEGALQRAGRQPVGLRRDVLAALEAHPWPGNVRELKAVIERALLLARGAELEVRHLRFAPRASEPQPVADPSALAEPPPSAAVAVDHPELAHLSATERADRADLIRALEECAGNQTRTARRLGISRTTLVGKLRLYRIPRPRS